MPRRRITLDLEESLLQSLDRFAAERNQSRNQFILDSVRALEEPERRRIDEAFARMAHDPDYVAMLREVDSAFLQGSEDAWKVIPPYEEAP
ncbi:MAG: hypothetical protein AB1758_28820 [Candidatus Eremiobacterota bacterium]